MGTRKVWLGVGAAILVAPPGAAMPPPHDEAVGAPRGPVLAQHGGQAAPPAARSGGEGGGEGEGAAADESLAPALRFYRNIQLVRGHLLVGDELVREGRWADALAHFLHPTEEVYGKIRGELRTYDVPPFETALKALAQTVKARNREAYARALGVVNERLAAADRGVRAREGAEARPWARFSLETAIETLKVAGDEYGNAVEDGRFKLAVEYQDSRGFMLQAERLVEGVAGELGPWNAEALAAIRAAFADLKRAWPAPTPPAAPVMDPGEVLADMSRIELQLAAFR